MVHFVGKIGAHPLGYLDGGACGDHPDAAGVADRNQIECSVHRLLRGVELDLRGAGAVGADRPGAGERVGGVAERGPLAGDRRDRRGLGAGELARGVQRELAQADEVVGRVVGHGETAEVKDVLSSARRTGRLGGRFDFLGRHRLPLFARV